jgi:WD40 repeat protein
MKIAMMNRSLYAGAVLLTLLLFAPAGAEEPTDRGVEAEALPEFAVRRIGARSFRPGGQIVGLGFFPDGKSVIVGTRNRTIAAWDVATGGETVRIATPYGIERFELSPDGKYAAVVAERDRTLPPGTAVERHVWDLERREIIARLPHRDYQGVLAFSPDGSLLATSDAGSAQIWDLPEGKLQRTLVHPEARTTNVSPRLLVFSPNGRTLASQCGHEIRLWDVENGEERCHVELNNGTFGMAFLADGKELIVGDEEAVRFLDANSGAWVSRMEVSSEAWVMSLAVSPDAKLLAVGPDDIIIDLRTGVQVAQLPLERGEFAFSPDGKTLATGSDGRVQLWRMPDGREITPIASDENYGPVFTLAISPDGQYAATIAGVGHDPELRLAEIATGKLRAVNRQHIPRPVTYSPGRGTPFLVFTPAGDRLISASTGAGWHLNFWDSPALNFRFDRRAHEYSVHCVAVSPDGRTLISSGGDKSICAWKLPGCEALYEIKDRATSCLAFSPKGDYFASGGALSGGDAAAAIGARTGVVRVWSAETGELQREIAGHEGAVSRLAVSRNGEVIASLCRSPDPFYQEIEPIRVWSSKTGRLLRAVRPLKARVNCVAFSPVCNVLASGGKDGVVSLWSAKTGTLLEELAGHRGEVASLAFTPDGRQLISGGSDCTMMVWDVTSWMAF